MECGVAYATAIAHGVDPSSLQLDQAAMRGHLTKCFRQKRFTLFPSVTI